MTNSQNPSDFYGRPHPYRPGPAFRLSAIGYRLSRAKRGSVLVIVMITLLFAVAALLAFMEKASVDLMVDQRDVLTKRLRREAYSALEVTLGVLTEFREVGGGLRSPAEGWDDPLGFAGYEPEEGRVVDVRFEDESGKISLPRADAAVLTQLFENWGMLKAEAETLADAMLGWMKRGHVYSTAIAPDYEGGPIPFEPPGRPMRSYHELAAIEKAREVFYDQDGRPNDLWKRFTDSVSLLDFPRSNINGARPDTLAAVGGFDPTQQQALGEYLGGGGSYFARGPRYFRNAGDAQRIAGPTGNAGAFGSEISALRIFITVREGLTEYRLAAVVTSPNGGATTVQQTATSTRTETSAKGAEKAAKQQKRASASKSPSRRGKQQQQPNAQGGNLRYPFTLLEIRENDEIPSAPPAPPPDSLI